MHIYIHTHTHKACVYKACIKHIYMLHYTYALYTYICVCICFINMYVYVFKIFKEMGVVTHIFNLSTPKQKQAGICLRPVWFTHTVPEQPEDIVKYCL